MRRGRENRSDKMMNFAERRNMRKESFQLRICKLEIQSVSFVRPGSGSKRLLLLRESCYGNDTSFCMKGAVLKEFLWNSERMLLRVETDIR